MSIPFLSFIEPIFAWNVPWVSLIFLKRSRVFPILLFSSISLHWSLRKAFLSLLAILWNSAFKWEYLSFSPLLFCFSSFHSYLQGLLRQPFCLLHFFFLGMVLIPVFCTISQTSVHSSSGILSIRSIPLNLSHFHCIVIRDWFRSYLNSLVVFPTFFNLSLNLAIRSSWSEPQWTPGLVFADCIELLHLWLQRI